MSHLPANRQGRSVDLAHVFERRRAIIDASIIRILKKEKITSVDNIALKAWLFQSLHLVFTMHLPCSPDMHLLCFPGMYFLFYPGMHLPCSPGMHLPCSPGMHLLYCPGMHVPCHFLCFHLLSFPVHSNMRVA